MRPVGFGEFYTACRDRLTDGQLRTLDPGSEYYEHAGTYWGWRVDGPGIWLSIVVGDVKGLQLLKGLLIQTGAQYFGWACRKGSPAYAWARYWGASIDDVGSRYPDGEIAWRVRIDRQQAPRLKKIVEAVKA